MLALGAAAVLACFCQADADPALLAREETAALAAALLAVRGRGRWLMVDWRARVGSGLASTLASP